MDAAFITELSPAVGSGHLMETVALAGAFKGHGSGTIRIYVDCPPDLGLPVAAHGIEMARMDVHSSVDAVCKDANGAVVIDLRDVSKSLASSELARIRGVSMLTVIDELGGKSLDADMIVNGSVVDEWHGYDSGPGTELLLGPGYMIMRPEFGELHSREKKKGKTARILVAMGGVDSKGLTLNVVSALLAVSPDVRKTVVVGANFPFMEELSRKIEGRPDFTVLRNISDMALRMFESEVAITCGGNALYEHCCVGTPGVVLHELPHERIQGEAFEKLGAVVCLGNGLSFDHGDLLKKVDGMLGDKTKWYGMSGAGKRALDGRGLERIRESIIRRTACKV